MILCVVKFIFPFPLNLYCYFSKKKIYKVFFNLVSEQEARASHDVDTEQYVYNKNKLSICD